MRLEIKHQEKYSRAELILRSLFGWIYITLPHGFILWFLSIWASILGFIAFWAILFTGKYPQSFYEFQVKYTRWSIRLQARMYNLADGYPSFGINASDEFTEFDVKYPDSLSRSHALLKLLFGWLYCAIPHTIVWFFRLFASYILTFLAWWVVLFTGKYPESWHRFNVGTIRWIVRVGLYMSYMTDKYPPFSGAPDAEEPAMAPVSA